MHFYMKRAHVPSFVLISTLCSLGTAWACDTWVALPDATETRVTLLAKNSDRTLYDCQPMMLHPRQLWPAGSTIDLGRITIPQVAETYATLGSSPYWCWGYEEGINEFGVAIGNEGVFTKELEEQLAAAASSKSPKLGPTGMDLLRLGLERGKTAREALDVITSLVEQYGQFGSGMPTQGLAGAYDNSYIIADAHEAWVLETAGTRWIAKLITQGTASISNTLSITKEWDLASSDLVEYATTKGWWPSQQARSFDFQRAYLANAPAYASQAERARTRATCSSSLLRKKRGKITPQWMMRIARDRSTSPSIDLSVTASSCVAVLPQGNEQLPVMWWAPAVPSTSCYVPFFVHGSQLPKVVSNTGTHGRIITPPSQVKRDTFSEDSYWWQFRDLSDMTSVARDKRGPVVRNVFDALELDFAAALPDILEKAGSLRKAGLTKEATSLLDSYTADCVERALQAARKLRAQFAAEPTAEAPTRYKPFVGNYLANFGPFTNVKFRVFVFDDKLSVDVPGQSVFELKEPDKRGMWYFALTNDIAMSFDRDQSGRVVAMRMHQSGATFELPRTGS